MGGLGIMQDMAKVWTEDKKEGAIKIIFHQMSEGESVRAILPNKGRAEHLPSQKTFYEWLDEDEQLSERYARACEARADKIFEEILVIADDGTNDWMETEAGPQLNHEHVQRSKLRIDSRKWLLAKMMPKKYGDRQAIEHSGKDGSELPSKIEFVVKRNNED